MERIVGVSQIAQHDSLSAATTLKSRIDLAEDCTYDNTKLASIKLPRKRRRGTVLKLTVSRSVSYNLR